MGFFLKSSLGCSLNAAPDLKKKSPKTAASIVLENKTSIMKALGSWLIYSELFSTVTIFVLQVIFFVIFTL